MKVTPSGMSFETDRLQDQPLVDLLNEKDEKGKWSVNGPSKAGRKNASFFLSALSSMGHFCKSTNRMMIFHDVKPGLIIPRRLHSGVPVL
jgi:hypothetical protein